MKNYESWSTEKLEQEKKDLRLMIYDKNPDICELDRRDNLQMIRWMKDSHAELLAVCNVLQSRQNRET